MSNSSLVAYTKISPNKTKRNKKICKITPHHMAGNLSVETCGNVFATTDRQASSNYGIGTDGRIGMYVPEDYRAWTSSNRDNDEVAVTIEVANDGGAPDWHVSDKALAALIDLCVDICKRNGIDKLNFTGDKSGNLTMHKWFAYTACPGPYLESKFPYIAEEVNKRLGAKETPAEPEKPVETKPETKTVYRVQVGAYNDYAGAADMKKKLKAAGFESFIVASTVEGAGNADNKEDENKETSKDELNVGDKVKLVAGAKYFDGRDIPSWVFNKTLYVRQIYTNGNVVFSTQPIGAVTGVVERKCLTKV